MRFLLLFLFLTLELPAQEMRFQKGLVTDNIAVNDSVGESYAMYLPLDFNGRDPLPVIFIFDPEGRGRNAAQLFKPTAEEQGYILVSSNNISSEKQLKDNILTAARLINTVASRLPVDYRQMSVAGLDHGAEVVTSLPMIFNNLFGVIPIGDQRLNLTELNEDNRFSFIGIVGDQQISRYAMMAAADQLSSLDFPTAVYSYEGGSGWPNPQIVSAAVGSLTLQAMRQGLRPTNRELIEKLYQNDISAVNQMISNNRYVEANRRLEILERKYDDLYDTREIEQKQRHLQNSRNFEEQQDRYAKAKQEEMYLIEDYIYFINQDAATANFANLGWWNAQKIELVDKTKSPNEAQQDMAYRLLSMLDQYSEEKMEELFQAGASLEQKLFASMLQTIFDQKNFEAYKNIISLSAIDGDFDSALFYLEEMLKNGFMDVEELYELEGTLGLKLTEEFNWLIEKYTGKSKYYDVENKLQ